MYDLTDFESYKTYFQALATKHKLIDSFSCGDQDVMNNEINVWAGLKLWLWPYGEVRTEENSNDNNLDRVPGSLFVGGVPPSASFEDEEAYYNKCEGIVKDLRNKILFDINEGTLITRLNGITRDRVEINMSTKFIGYELKFFFHDPTGFVYDADDETKWNP